MTQFSLIFLLPAFLGVISSCKESHEPYESYRTLYVDVNQNDTVEYYTTITNYSLDLIDLEQQARHYRISEIYFDPKEVVTLYHRYAPELGFVGKDSILLKNESHGVDSPEILGVLRVKVIFDVK
ncbi:MAG: hypothetical protein ABJN36_20355 [Cyclobacteriaceae bacterium]